MSRPLYFGVSTETALTAAALNEFHLQELRSKYRYAVFTLGYSPQQAFAATVSVTAGGALATSRVPLVPEEVDLYGEDYYSSPEHALLAMAEYSGLGYETLPAFRAAWRRGVLDLNPENPRPFQRACGLAVKLYDSIDADLLPRVEPVKL